MQGNKRRPRGHPSDRRSENITIGDISGGVGIAIGTGAKAVVSQSHGIQADEIAHAFSALEKALASMPDSPRKEAAAGAVETLEKEARKGEKADESQARKWLDFLVEMAPDVGEVAIDTFINPIKGVGTVFKKIAERAKAERIARDAAKI